jgi:hypothetical protein
VDWYEEYGKQIIIIVENKLMKKKKKMMMIMMMIMMMMLVLRDEGIKERRNRDRDFLKEIS